MLERQKGAVEVELDDMEKRLHNVTKEYEKLKVVLEQKQNAKKVRQNSSTTFEMINNPQSSTRYRRRRETKNVVDFIHGGEEASLYCAWDYLSSSASESLMENLSVIIKGVLSYKVCLERL